jgi:hypothetical protein
MDRLRSRVKRKPLKMALKFLLKGTDPLHQVTLDDGWYMAWLWTGLEDPEQRKEFAGEQSELATSAARMDAVADLRKRMAQVAPGDDTVKPVVAAPRGPGEDETAGQRKKRLEREAKRKAAAAKTNIKTAAVVAEASE